MAKEIVSGLCKYRNGDNTGTTKQQLRRMYHCQLAGYSLSICSHFTGHAKVSDLDLIVWPQQNVPCCQVHVDDASGRDMCATRLHQYSTKHARMS